MNLQERHDDCFNRRVSWNKPEVFTLEYWESTTHFDKFKNYSSYGETVLDIGSFTGELSILYSLRFGKKVTTVEISKSAYDFAVSQKQKFGGDVTFLNGNFEEMIFDTTFDTVVLSHVLEHTPDPVHTIMKAWSLCNDVMIIATPLGHAFDDPTHIHYWENLNWIKELLPHRTIDIISEFELALIIKR